MSHRRERVADEVRAEISRLLQRQVKDPRVGFVTVTEVRMSADLRTAQVYVSVLGDDRERADSLEALASAAGYLRREVGRALRLRYAPEIHFRLDHSLEQGSRIEQILETLSAERPEDDSEE